MKDYKLIIYILINLSLLFSLHAQDAINEDELFTDEPTVVETKNVEKISIASNTDKESTSLSGNIYQRSTYSMKRSWILDKASPQGNDFFAYIEGNAFLDIRLRKGIKAFIDLSAYYSPQGQWVPITYKQLEITNDNIQTNQVQYLEKVNTLVLFKEIFVDYNIKKSIYFRTGKQVLQWGRAYFWNPTDLINIDRKTFLNLTRYREGIFGNKIHIPFGTDVNIYNFIDFSDAYHFQNMAFALKLEFVLGGTELALSTWSKEHFYPVYGFDFSTRLFHIDVYGETSLSYGDNQKKLHVEKESFFNPYTSSWETSTEYKIVQTKKEWIPRATIGFSKSFDWVIPDRIMLTGEFFYNHSGYYNNMFNDAKSAEYFVNSGLYVPNYYGVYYGALFMTVNRVFVQDMSWVVNTIHNFNDKSYVISTGLDYQAIFNFTVGCLFSLYGGPPNTEYTYSGNAGTAEIYTSITF